MPKFRSARGVAVEDLLMVSRRETRATAVRRWIFEHPVVVVVINLAVAFWLFAVMNVHPTIALVSTVGATVLFFVWPVVAQLWRLRFELAVVAVLGAEWRFLPGTIFVTLVAVQVIVFAAVPQLRRLAENQFWCVVTSHRLRGVLERVATGKKVARTPTLLWTKSTPVGERVTVWLPSGMAIKDLENQLPQITAACWAKETRINPNRRWSHLAAFDIIRRDQLGHVIESEIATEFIGKLGEKDLAVADEHVTDFLKNITVDDIVAKQPVSANGAKAPRQRVKAETETVSYEDPF